MRSWGWWVWWSAVSMLCLGGCGGAGSPPRPLAPTAEEVLQKGTRLAAAGELVEAEQYLVAAERLGAPQSEVLPKLLRVCLRSGQRRRALVHLERALTQSPERSGLWVLAGAISWALGELGDAARYLRTAANLPTPSPDVAYWQARVSIAAGEQERARERLVDYLARSPHGRFASWARYWLAQQPGAAS